MTISTADKPSTTSPVNQDKPTIPSVPANNTKYSSTNIGVKINGSYVAVNSKPELKNDSTFIPLRGGFEALGGGVTWDLKSKSATIKKGNTTVKVTLGGKTAYVNGEAIALTTAPYATKEGYTYVPLRFISETIGASVVWDKSKWTININAA
ncbi:hypothetical protein HMSSN139_06410 [Paenibacillus sp. HMSSN-139]|nr:hypothetical protein HMSSN139_06410 [Paenibacillus sp. HMSSN-139]